MLSSCLNELRFLGSANFDSQCLFTTILCGETCQPEKVSGSTEKKPTKDI